MRRTLKTELSVLCNRGIFLYIPLLIQDNTCRIYVHMTFKVLYPEHYHCPETNCQTTSCCLNMQEMVEVHISIGLSRGKCQKMVWFHARQLKILSVLIWRAPSCSLSNKVYETYRQCRKLDAVNLQALLSMSLPNHVNRWKRLEANNQGLRLAYEQWEHEM